MADAFFETVRNGVYRALSRIAMNPLRDIIDVCTSPPDDGEMAKGLPYLITLLRIPPTFNELFS